MSLFFANETLRQVVHIAGAVARENYNASYGAPHLLRALMHPNAGLQEWLSGTGKDAGYFAEWADVRIETWPKTTSLPSEMTEHETVPLIMEEADEVRLRLGLDEVTPLCLLTALVKPHVAFTAEQLQSLPLRDHEILGQYKAVGLEGQSTGDAMTEGYGMLPKSGKADMAMLQKYCTDKTQLAASAITDPVIGREREIRTIIEVLGRRNKPNIIITGEPGVGKSALADGLAYAMVKGQVPLHLQQARLLELDMGLLLAGASYKGEVEDRLRKLITAIKQADRVILFIDEIHQLLDSKGAAGSGIANLLKPELARGSITVIGATTLEEYRKVIEPEQAFNRRFELLQLREPDLESCCKMIESLADRYEAHHQVKLDPDAIPECVRLARRYIKDKRLPDAALDLLDRTMAAIRMLDEVSMEELTQWKTMYDEITDTAYETEEQALAALRWAYRQLQDRVSPILWGGLVQQPDMTKITDVASFRQMIAEVYEALCAGAAVKREKAGKLELAAVTAAKTGIPIGKIQAGEKEKLLHIEKDLRRRVVGQDHALKALSDAIIESRSGINKPGQPIGSFFLLGPTGTGKTELAKAMAELLFGDEKAMIRFDMSEFKEEHAAALLYGAPPGYVGYEEGGMLVNRIRQQPYSVVLFDEIEKAHASVFDIFLQIMDEGRISDKLGKEGDFSNALILFTSNIASGQIIDCFAEGRVPATSELMQAMAGHFRPEFLGRLTEIVPFGPVTESMAVRIFQIRLQTLTEPLSRLGIGFRISDEAAKMLALSAYDARYGARQISGIIRAQLSRPVSAMIVREEVQKGQEIVVSLQEDGQLLWQVLPIQQVEQVS